MVWIKERHTHTQHTFQILRFHLRFQSRGRASTLLTAQPKAQGSAGKVLGVSGHIPTPAGGSHRPSCIVFFLSLQGRSHLNHEKETFAQDHPEVNSLGEVVRLVKTTAIIGRRRGRPAAQPS